MTNFARVEPYRARSMHRDTPIIYKTTTTDDIILLPHTLNEGPSNTLIYVNIIQSENIDIAEIFILCVQNAYRLVI